jgi:glycosyltransferase involved in cell wall biosynthesis
VALPLEKFPDRAALNLTGQAGIELIYVRANGWRYDPRILKLLLNTKLPQLVHMHSLYWPRQAVLAWYFVRNYIPFVVTPNGGLARQSKRLKKNLYVALVERPRLRAAAAITVVDPQEEKAVRADVPDYGGIVRWIPNPVDTRGLEGFTWNENVEAKRLIFLGRFHVVHKGLDIMVDIASLLPDVEFHLYGKDDGRTSGMLEQLRRRTPPNVHFHGPVFETEKAEVLANASLYIQTSRWEGFPLSIIEAMYLGVPRAIASTFFQAELFSRDNLGLVFPPRPEEAAAQLSRVLNEPDRLRHRSRRSRDLATRNFNPLTVASTYINLYVEILDVRSLYRTSSRKATEQGRRE